MQENEGWEDLDWLEYEQANQLFWAWQGHLMPLAWSTEAIQKTHAFNKKQMKKNPECISIYSIEGFDEAWGERVEYCSSEIWDGDTFEEEWPEFADNMEF